MSEVNLDAILKKTNLKSDVPAKEAFCMVLRQRGFERVKVTASPADITAFSEGRQHYYEIKYTKTKDNYFGGATLTEWEAAMENIDRYCFVIARDKDGIWEFTEYTPEEFMKFSTIPPFKIFFNIPVGNGRAKSPSLRNKKRKRLAVVLTKERITQMIELFDKFKS